MTRNTISGSNNRCPTLGALLRMCSAGRVRMRKRHPCGSSSSSSGEPAVDYLPDSITISVEVRLFPFCIDSR